MTFSPTTVNRLRKELIESFLRVRHDNSLAINWLERAYIANAESMGRNHETPETNLNDLLAHMSAIPSSLCNSVRDAFEAMLIYAITDDKINEGMHLDAAWSYLCNGNEQRIDSMRKAFMNLRGKHTHLNEKKRDVPHRLILASLLNESEHAISKQIDRLVNLIFLSKESRLISKTLSDTHRMFPLLGSKIGVEYTRVFLDSGFIVERPVGANLSRLNLLFPTAQALHQHATSTVNETFSNTICGFHPETIHAEIDAAFELLALIGEGIEKQNINKVIATNFDHFINLWRSENEINNKDIRHERLAHFLIKLEEIDIDWPEILRVALCTHAEKQYNDPILAAGESLVRSRQYFYKVLLCEALLLKTSTKDIIERFHDNQDVLLSIHAFTNNSALVVKMNQQTKRQAISKDLGI